MPGYAACVMCHTWQTSLRFDLETPATDAGWTAEQSRRNFEMITQLVNTRIAGEQLAAPEAARAQSRVAWDTPVARTGPLATIPSIRPS